MARATALILLIALTIIAPPVGIAGLVVFIWVMRRPNAREGTYLERKAADRWVHQPIPYTDEELNA